MEEGTKKPPSGRKKGLPENVRSEVFTLRVTKAERASLEILAQQSNKTVGEYMRSVAFGYKISARLDLEIIRKLITCGGSMGKLGGLLKQLLSQEEGIGPGQINPLLRQIEEAQYQMKLLIMEARRKI